MDPIRASALPPITPAAAGAEAARLAAQRAFFEAALGRTDMDKAAPTAAATDTQVSASRPARPGSILDIRV